MDTLNSILHHIQHGQSTRQRAAPSLSSLRCPRVWPAGCCIESTASASHHAGEAVLSLQSAGVFMISYSLSCHTVPAHSRLSSPVMPPSPPGNARCRESGSVGAIQVIPEQHGRGYNSAMLMLLLFAPFLSICIRSRLPELKRPNARIHLKLARKYYMARLAELRSKLSLQEDQIRWGLFTLLLLCCYVHSNHADLSLSLSFLPCTDAYSKKKPISRAELGMQSSPRDTTSSRLRRSLRKLYTSTNAVLEG